MKKKNIIIISVLILIILIISICLFLEKDDKKIVLDFKDRLETINNLEANSLKDGWIQVQGTNIDMPVMVSASNVDSSFKQDYAWRGFYFDDDNGNRKSIGGHNVLNVSNKPIKNMTDLKDFEGLMAFTYYSFAKDNLYIKYTNYYTQEEALYKIYAIGFYDYYDSILMSFDKDDKSTIDGFLKMAKENSIYDYDVDVNSNDELITVFTCTRFFGASEKQQLFVDARRVRDNEKIEKYGVKKTKLNVELGMYD